MSNRKNLVVNKLLPDGMIFYPLHSIAEIVCNYYGLEVYTLINKGHKGWTLSNARHMIRWNLITKTMIRACEYDPFEEFSAWDHSQMLRSRKTVDDLLSVKDKRTVVAVKAIDEAIAERRLIDQKFNSIFFK